MRQQLDLMAIISRQHAEMLALLMQKLLEEK